MADCTTTLSEDHELMRRMLDALERWTAEVLRRNDDARAELARFMVFFHGFVDGSHHAKEEEVLFRALLQRENGQCRALLGELLRDHENGRALLGPLEDLAYQAHPWSDADREHLRRASSEYANALREHVAKEEGSLLPLTRERLDADARRRVGEEFLRFELGGRDLAERARKIADELVACWNRSCEHVHRGTAEHAAHDSSIR